MPAFLGKTISDAEATRIRNGHLSKVNASGGGSPTLAEVETHYLQMVDNEVIYSDRAAVARAASDSPIGLVSK